MNLIRDPEQAALADLDAFGGGLLQRYKTLLEADVDPRLSAVLKRLVALREPLIEELARREAARNEQPTAAEVEINEIRAAVDRVLGGLFGAQVSGRRIAHSEAEWLERLQQVEGLDWEPQERDLLERLQADAEQALSRLSVFDD